MAQSLSESIHSPELPHSLEAEQAVLGGLMLVNDVFDDIANIISEADFFQRDHRIIFSTMMELAANDQPLDALTLSETLKNTDQLVQTGGDSYLVELVNNTSSAANIRAYAQIVLERSVIRQLIGAATDIVQKGYNPLGWDSSKLLAEAERRLLEVMENRPKSGGFRHVTDLLREVIARIDVLFESDSAITGLSTSFTELDDMTSGWQQSDLVIVAGRPSMGKTAFALNMAEHAMLTQDRPVLVFSMEMPASQLVMRMLSSIGKIDQTALRSGDLHPDDFSRLATAAARLKDQPLYIDDTPGINPMELRNRMRKQVKECRDQLKKDKPDLTPDQLDDQSRPAMVMVDYLQLMSGSTQSEGRVQEISQISRELKTIAREFSCPVIALSQLSRNVEQRPNKRPINSDLRESGAIEQDADVIVFIYRDEVYNEESPDKGMAEIIIGKQRNGPIGTARLAFLGKYTRFENLARDYFSGDE
ncbi:MAG: replicative DNA helicase [Porticoccaceae bacterium]|nr:replicative DNA helicase [Porticoccaceae bacterium]